MFRSDELEHGIAQVLESLVVGRSAFRVLVVIGAVRQRLPQQRNVMKPDTKRPLEFV
jgi:hypothetical protein